MDPGSYSKSLRVLGKNYKKNTRKKDAQGKRDFN